MKTIYSPGPGFYAAMSNKADKSIPAGKLRLYMARLEAIELTDEIDKDTTFAVLFAFAENPEIAKGLLLLGDAIESNRKELQKRAKGL